MLERELQNLPALLTTKEVSGLLSRSESNLKKLRGLGKGPQWIKEGRHVLYPKPSVLEYLESMNDGDDSADGQPTKAAA